MTKIKPGTLVQVVPEHQWRMDMSGFAKRYTANHGWLYFVTNEEPELVDTNLFYHCRSVATREIVGWYDFELIPEQEEYNA